MSLIIVMLGAPGVGKGTQTRLLAEKYGYPHISTGDILREMAKSDTPLGREVRGVMASGRLVRDEVLAEIILTRTSQPDCANGYILDGFPRTLDQARLLEELALKQGNAILTLKLILPRQALMQRLTGRRTCTKCGRIYNIFLSPPKQEGICDVCGGALAQRSDDRKEVVATRIADYERATKPLTDYYQQSGRLVKIKGDRTVEEVLNDLSAAIDSIDGRRPPKQPVIAG
ncbi:MAG TPA: adenylate kinase [Blastocatellia bacterium]|nr:adenylate kinase [Blastocatellia bacterium]